MPRITLPCYCTAQHHVRECPAHYQALVDGAATRTAAELARSSRDAALDAAIKVCEDFANDGGLAVQCKLALQDMKSMLPAPPSAAN